MRSQGGSDALLDAVGADKLDSVKIAPKDQALLKYVKQLTLNPGQMKDNDVQMMRDAGWTDEQIWEASLEVGIFSLLNRMADAHGLDYPAGGWLPPELRNLKDKKPEPNSAPADTAKPE